MQAHRELTTEWRDWIAHNLARGCDPQTMVADMIRSQFDPVFAHSVVFGFSANQVAAKESYAYETPRIAMGNVLVVDGREMRVLLRVERPVVAFIDNLLDADECDELVRRSASRLERSTIVDPQSGAGTEIANRSSEGTYFPIEADPFIARLDRRIAALMNAPVENGEGLQILHYRTGGEYTPHFDYFPPADPGSAAHIAQGGQRVSSLIMYLNDVAGGGSTVFPELNLTVGPKKGAGVYFEYCNSRGQVDPLTLHGGLPVLEGEKWIATKWVRQRRYGT
jgi:prolyl 4-hydroxylase